MDVHDKKTRSYNMSRIRAKNTKPEVLVRKFLFSKGYRYRLHVKSLPGKPDIFLRKYNIAIFVNGCFWHGHNKCKYFILPKTRTAWWKDKIEKNIANDHNYIIELKKRKIKTITIWECELKKGSVEKTMNKLLRNLRI